METFTPSPEDSDKDQRYIELLHKFGAEYLLEPFSSSDDERPDKLSNVFKFVGTLANFKIDHPLNPNSDEKIDQECYEMGRLIVARYPNTTRKWVEKGLAFIQSGVDPHHRQILIKEFYRWEQVFWESCPDLYKAACKLGEFSWNKTS